MESGGSPHVFLRQATQRLAEFGTIGVPDLVYRVKFLLGERKTIYTAIRAEDAVYSRSWYEFHDTDQCSNFSAKFSAI